MIHIKKASFVMIVPLGTLFLNTCYYSLFYYVLYQTLGIVLSDAIFWSGFVCAFVNVSGCYWYAVQKINTKFNYTEKEKSIIYMLLSITNIIVHAVGTFVIGKICGWSVMENYGIYYSLINIWILILMCIIALFNVFHFCAMILNNKKQE